MRGLSAIRSDPDWHPTTNNQAWGAIDQIKVEAAKIITSYTNIMKPSGIRAPIDVFIKSSYFNKYADIYKKLITTIYEAFKDFTTDAEKQQLLDVVKDIANTSPQETFDITNPKTGEIIITLYTPEDKLLASEVLKNLGGNINYDPLKFNVKRKTNSQDYKNAWNKVVSTLDKKQFDDETLGQVLAAINNA